MKMQTLENINKALADLKTAKASLHTIMLRAKHHPDDTAEDMKRDLYIIRHHAEQALKEING